jgi:hypothetical protein
MPEAGFTDDPSIGDETELWRCIPPLQYDFDHNRARWRPSSIAFRDNSNGDPMSAFIAAECGGVEALQALLPEYLIVRFTAVLARQQCGQVVARDPEHGPAGHVVIVGNKRQKVDYNGKRTMVCQVLAYECEWVVPPPEAQE